MPYNHFLTDNYQSDYFGDDKLGLVSIIILGLCDLVKAFAPCIQTIMEMN